MLLLAAAMASCASEPADMKKSQPDPARVIKGLPDLMSPAAASPSEEVLYYLDLYGLLNLRSSYRCGTIAGTKGSGGLEPVAVHVFENSQTPVAGTVVLLHGYLEHALINAPTIRRLLKEGYAVLALDLPGHGLSSGPRGGIQSFDEYGEMVASALEAAEGLGLPGPYFGVGHSTGAASLLEYLNGGAGRLKACVFVAPLVRIQVWGPLKTFFPVADSLLDGVPNITRDISSDKDFLKFLREEDPLVVRELAFSWVRALLAWEPASDEPDTSRPVLVPVLAVQGDADVVVEWRHNLGYLGRKIPALRQLMITGGKHDLLNEAEPLREEVFAAMVDFLRSKGLEHL